MFVSNAYREYMSACKSGRRFLSKNSGDECGGYLLTLNALPKNEGTLSQIALGIHEIPMKLIVGTYNAARSRDFSGNFMPLLSKHSELATKWQYLYTHQINDGICDPIKAIEYLGKLYVIEGVKRVSVMKYLGACSITGDVVRLIPLRNDDETLIYYEKLDYDLKGFWYSDMEFAKRGAFSELVSLATEYADSKDDIKEKDLQYWLPTVFRVFASRYYLQNSDPQLKNGDAFLEYIRTYGFTPLME